MTRLRSPAAALSNRIANREIRISLLRSRPDPDLEAIRQLEAEIAELEQRLDGIAAEGGGGAHRTQVFARSQTGGPS